MRLTLFVTGAFVDGVTLSALGPEDLLTGLGVSWWCFIERRHFRWGRKLRRNSLLFRVCFCEDNARDERALLTIKIMGR